MWTGLFQIKSPPPPKISGPDNICHYAILQEFRQKSDTKAHHKYMLWQNQMVGSCEHNNEPLDSTKSKKFLEHVSNHHVF
jgi:hypothetical protein